MKETADLIYHNNVCGIEREQRRRHNFCSIPALKKILLPLKQELLSGLATLAIGSIFLLSIYLFFTQLAEYGW